MKISKKKKFILYSIVLMRYLKNVLKENEINKLLF